jgi:hypothetical protein
MKLLSRGDLFSLEEYAERRKEFRHQVIEHKRHRNVSVGQNLRFYFEDRLTIQYQIQEMLRIEKVFEPAGIEDELDAYNPLIPDGSNLKATLMIEFENSDERRIALRKLVGIEDCIWLTIDGSEPVFAIANEDLPRSTVEKTSAVHFLRFEFTPPQIELARKGAAIILGVSHPEYESQLPLDDDCRDSLVADFS